MSRFSYAEKESIAIVFRVSTEFKACACASILYSLCTCYVVIITIIIILLAVAATVVRGIEVIIRIIHYNLVFTMERTRVGHVVHAVIAAFVLVQPEQQYHAGQQD